MTASLLEQLDVEPAFVEWARGRGSLLEAFERAPRGDWLIQLAMRVGIDRRRIVAAAVEGVRLLLRDFSDRRIEGALARTERWARGQASAAECWAAGFAAATAAGDAAGKPLADALMAAARIAFACDDEATDWYYAERAYAAEALWLAAQSRPGTEAVAHELAAGVIRARIPFESIGSRVDLRLVEPLSARSASVSTVRPLASGPPSSVRDRSGSA
jgi:hypothetical protein